MSIAQCKAQVNSMLFKNSNTTTSLVIFYGNEQWNDQTMKCEYKPLNYKYFLHGKPIINILYTRMIGIRIHTRKLSFVLWVLKCRLFSTSTESDYSTSTLYIETFVSAGCARPTLRVQCVNNVSLSNVYVQYLPDNKEGQSCVEDPIQWNYTYIGVQQYTEPSDFSELGTRGLSSDVHTRFFFFGADCPTYMVRKFFPCVGGLQNFSSTTNVARDCVCQNYTAYKRNHNCGARSQLNCNLECHNFIIYSTPQGRRQGE